MAQRVEVEEQLCGDQFMLGVGDQAQSTSDICRRGGDDERRAKPSPPDRSLYNNQLVIQSNKYLVLTTGMTRGGTSIAARGATDD